MKYTRQFRVLALSATPGSDIKVRFSFNTEWADSQIVGLGEVQFRSVIPKMST